MAKKRTRMDELKDVIYYGPQKARAKWEIEDAWHDQIRNFPLWIQWRKEVLATKVADRTNILRLISHMPKSEEQAMVYNFVMAMERRTTSYKEFCDELDACIQWHSWPGMEELADLIRTMKANAVCDEMREQIKDIEMLQFRNNKALEAIKEANAHDKI